MIKRRIFVTDDSEKYASSFGVEETAKKALEFANSLGNNFVSISEYCKNTTQNACFANWYFVVYYKDAKRDQD
jgi:hypothetical protein